MDGSLATSRTPLILIVDDEPTQRMTLRRAMEQNGYQVVEAANGEEALEIAFTLRPDIVLMDALMPVMDGFTACARLCECFPTLRAPVIIITCLDDRASVDRAFAAGASDFVTKPIHWAVLRQRVRRLLHESRVEGALRALEAELRHQSLHDPLTGLPNRALFMDRLQHARARAERQQRAIAVLCLDLDHFKLINDSLGHDAGDRALKVAADRMRGCLRSSDTVARFGGDKFMILLEGITDSSSAVAVADAIVARLEEPLTLGEREVTTTGSIGVAVSFPGQDRPADLPRDADLALYHAKANGRSRTAMFDPSMSASALARLDLQSDLRRALERGEFTVYYQPKVVLRTGQIVAVEALARWQHPTRGLVPPAQFIPVAEEIGLIVPLGRWVLTEACRQMRAWQARLPAAPPLDISVNLSAQQFQHPELVADVGRILRETGLEPARLELELTESTIMEHGGSNLLTLQALKRLGVQLAIDDFGTGYSSLSYLKRFPVDTLKIDRSFVAGLGRDPDDTAIVAAIQTLAHTLNLVVVAEGIETDEQVVLLRALGCEQGQGYHFGRPLGGDAAESLLLSGSEEQEQTAPVEARSYAA